MKLGMSYVAEHLPEHIDEDMKAIADMGCTEVLAAFLEPSLFGGINGAFRRSAEIGRRNGLAVYALMWGYANSFGGGKVSKFMLEDTSVWRVRADGSLVGRGCLNNPKFLDYFEKLARKCYERGYQGIYIDGPGRMHDDKRPGRERCFCQHCQTKFRQQYGGDLLASENAPEFEEFAAKGLVDFVNEACGRAKAIDPQFRTIICMWPKGRDSVWEPVAAVRNVDAFGGYPYWHLPYVGYQGSLDAAVADAYLVQRLAAKYKKESWIWLGAYEIPKGREEEIVYEGGKRLAAAGCDAIYTWTYRSGLGLDEESDDPDAAWEQVRRLYGELASI
jgi:hypothetical protein